MMRFGRDRARFEALGIQILGLSYDDPATQGRFAVHCAADFPFLSDPGGQVATLYRSAGGFGPIHFAQRHTVLVDAQGTIRAVYEGMPDDDRILADARRLLAGPGPRRQESPRPR